MAGVWSTGGNLRTKRQHFAGCGTQTAGLSFGGDPSYSVVTEAYNGTTWSSGGDLATGRSSLGGCGTQSAGLSFGGYVLYYTNVTEEYNGTVWSSGGNLTTTRSGLTGCGTQSAGLSFGGSTGSYSVVTEEYDGTAWSSGGNLTTARSGLAGCGTQSAGLSFGGNTGSISAVTEEYNGTAWSSGGDLATARKYLYGCGAQSTGLSFGGHTGSISAVTEEYNGTIWSSGGDLTIGRSGLAGCGTQSAGLSFGGSKTIYLLSVATEEYDVHFTLGNHRSIAGIDSGVLFAGKTLIGDRTNGKIYYLDMNTYTDNGQPIARIRRTQIINKEKVNVIHNRIEVEFEPGVGLEAGGDPQATLKWSNDGGKTWSSGRSVDIGEYRKYGTRAIWRRLGKSRNRIYELTIEEPVKIILIGAYANIKACAF